MAEDIRQQRKWRRRVMKPQVNRAGLLMPYTQMYHDQLLKGMDVRVNRKGWNLFGECFSPYSAADFSKLLGGPAGRSHFEVQVPSNRNHADDFSTCPMSMDYSVRPGRNPYQHARNMLPPAQPQSVASAYILPSADKTMISSVAQESANTVAELDATSLYATQCSVGLQGYVDDRHGNMRHHGGDGAPMQYTHEQHEPMAGYGGLAISRKAVTEDTVNAHNIVAGGGAALNDAGVVLGPRASQPLRIQGSTELSGRDSLSLPLPPAADVAEPSSLFGGLPLRFATEAAAGRDCKLQVPAAASMGGSSNASKLQARADSIAQLKSRLDRDTMAQLEPQLGGSPAQTMQASEHHHEVITVAAETPATAASNVIGYAVDAFQGCDTPVPLSPGVQRGHARRASNLCMQRRLSESSVASNSGNLSMAIVDAGVGMGSLSSQQQTIYDHVRIAMRSCDSYSSCMDGEGKLVIADGSYENPFAEHAAKAVMTPVRNWRGPQMDRMPASPASPATSLMYAARPASFALVQPLLGSPADSSNAPKRLATQQLWQDTQMLELLAAPPPCISSKKVLGVNTGMRTLGGPQGHYHPSLLRHTGSGVASPISSPHHHALQHSKTASAQFLRAGSDAFSRQQSEAGIGSPADSVRSSASNDSGVMMNPARIRHAAGSAASDASMHGKPAGVLHSIPAGRMMSLTRFAKSHSSAGETALTPSPSERAQSGAGAATVHKGGGARQVTRPSGALDITAIPSRLSCTSSACMSPATASATISTRPSDAPAAASGSGHEGNVPPDSRVGTPDCASPVDYHGISLNTDSRGAASTGDRLLFTPPASTSPAHAVNGYPYGAMHRNFTTENGVMLSRPGLTVRGQTVSRPQRTVRHTMPNLEVVQHEARGATRTYAMGAQEVFHSILHQGHALWAMHYPERALAQQPLPSHGRRFQPQMAPSPVMSGALKSQAVMQGTARSKTQPGEDSRKPPGALRVLLNKLTRSMNQRG